MQTYISILRGINVSGKNIIKMELLRKMLDGMKFKNVQTYIQSGNIIFQDKKVSCELLEKKIAKEISKTFKCEVPVMVKEAEELKIVLKNNAFVNKRKEDITKLHVTFLSDVPSKENMEKIKGGNYAADEYIFVGKNIYLFCPNGYGNTKLNNNFFEKKLKLTATTRNWNTINELVNIAANISNK